MKPECNAVGTQERARRRGSKKFRDVYQKYLFLVAILLIVRIGANLFLGHSPLRFTTDTMARAWKRSPAEARYIQVRFSTYADHLKPPPARRQQWLRNAPPHPPTFAQVLKVTLGVTAQRKLERMLGSADVTIGGHSNSGREWYFNNGLQLRSDGFDLGKDGYILDTLVFSQWRGQLGDTRAFAQSGVGVWKKLRVGMTPAACLAVLPAETRQPTIAPDSLIWQEKVFGARGSRHADFYYEATLRFSKGRLESLLLSGDMLNR